MNKLLSFIFLFSISCGKVEMVPNADLTNLSKNSSTKSASYENLIQESILFYDLENTEVDFMNMDINNIIDHGIFKALSFNQGGESGEYIQTTLDIDLSNNVSISLWFNTNNINAVQTLLWQGQNQQNGWGGGTADTEDSEFNVGINHFTNNSGDSISAFYGYNDKGLDPYSVNFPYAPNGDVNGNLFQLSNNRWYHLVVNLKKTSTKVTISTFLNGSLQNEGEGTQIDTGFWNRDFRVGRPGVNNRLFSGQIANFLVLDRLLSTEEIEEVYSSGIR